MPHTPPDIEPAPTSDRPAPVVTVHIDDATHDCDDCLDAADVLAVVERHHDDTHPGAWPFCPEQPCHAIQRVLGPSRQEQRR